MKKLILLLLALTASAQAAVSEPDRAALGAFKNYAVNGGAEQNKAGWAVSGTSAALSNLAVSTSTKYEGNAGFTWTPANADNYLSNAALSISSNEGLSGRDCAALVFTKTTATDHAIEAYDGTNILKSVTIPSSTNWTAVSVNWPCSSSGSNRIRFNAGSTTALNFDFLVWGDARGINLSQSSQASIYGTILHPGTASCAWNTTSTSFGNFSADSDCSASPTVTGYATAPATKVPGVLFTNLLPGEYEVTPVFTALDGAGDSNSCYWRVSDGTSTGGVGSTMANSVTSYQMPHVSGRFVYTTAQSSVTFQLQGKTDNAGNTCQIQNTSADYQTQFIVKRFPLSTEQTYRPDQAAGSQRSYTGVAGYGSSNTTALRYSNETVSIGSDITRTASGTLGDYWTINSPGYYCMAGGLRESAGGNEWNIGRNVLGTINTDPSGTAITTTGNNGWIAKVGTITASPTQIAWCGYLAQGDVITTSIKAGLTFSTTWFTIVKVNNTSSAPLLVGSVTSNSSGVERIERAKITLSGTQTVCTVNSQSGSWITATSPSAPNCTLTTTGFSAAPSCTATVDGLASSAVSTRVGSITSNSVGFQCLNNSFAGVDCTIQLICMGSR